MFRSIQKLFSVRIPLLPVVLALVACAVVTCTATQMPMSHGVDCMVAPSVYEVADVLRASVEEWDNATGQYAWLTNPLRERGVTTEEVLRFCDVVSPLSA